MIQKILFLIHGKGSSIDKNLLRAVTENAGIATGVNHG
jgi:hypothetical protein